jgi:hypothetical protein
MLKEKKKTSDFIKIRKGQNFYADYQMVPFGFYQLKLKNVNCLNEFDEFSFRMYPFYNENDMSNQITGVLGCYENLFNESKIPACKWTVLWSVTRNGLKESHEQIFELTENEHKILEINY